MNNPTSTSRRCVLYMRYSSDNQHDTSIEYQRTANKQYAALHNYEIAREYVDEAYSALTDNRPSFQKLVYDVRTHPTWDTILVYDYSRYSRNTMDAIYYLNFFRDNNIQLISVTQPLSGTSPEARFMEMIYFAMNELNVRKLAEVTHAGQKVKATKAEHCGGIPPLGYDVGPDGHLVINEEEAELVRKIFSMYEQNYSYQRMADLLNAEGYLTKVGAPFTKNSFYSILHQKKYYGLYTWNRVQAKNSKRQRNNHAEKPLEEQVIIDNGCPPILSKEQFLRVQKRMGERSQGRAESKSRRHYMLGGMRVLKCGVCGRYMVGNIRKSHKIVYTTYRCPNHRKDGCTTKELPAQNLDRFVAVTIAHHLLNKNTLPALKSMMASGQSASQYEKLMNKKRGMERAARNLARALENNYSDTLFQQLLALEAQKAKVDASLAVEREKAKGVPDMKLSTLRSKFARSLCFSEAPEVRELLCSVIQEITITNDDIMIDLNI